MSVFNETMRQRGQAEEDMFYAKLDLELIAALHKKIDKEQQQVLRQIPTDSGYDR
ncbi:hypothetical protein [Moritella viscosa]|uniref:Uncharacterized protein n=1 Tax=Moritella viscosa TaxID=80854 RepID=A0ABY1HKB2_9GAMM|nr:hypothetical protein [Moritella viscosa]CED60301.1 putative uncharacterized protein [Moritella viscosa]SGY98341.1 Putative uncharacterized protein [Moritella viscosa]SGZ05157.1 Putative uncharacterized protein [Moritella viscosa]SGZ05407.1 Putative uncharacterized protein [Moritella viscosa]SGZ12326.1 Putative uncharacterized protein [Moritella viscosa]